MSINYRVRSVSLLDLINDINTKKLIPDAYFQRNLVWRDLHNKEFIKTILLGYPFPQIFISKGRINVATMSSVSCIVDGQQRSAAIRRFVNNEFEVDGRFFNMFSEIEKSEFLKYEIAVIELDLENDDPKVNDIFQRINRTSNSLSIIEKLASEYSNVEYMLVAKVLANEIDLNFDGIDEDFREDPHISLDFFKWARKQNVKKFQTLILKKNIFTKHEITRKVHLMHILNMMSTVISDFFNRNESTNKLLDYYESSFPEKNEIIVNFENTAYIILGLKLKTKSIWYNKSNSFSLIVAICKLGASMQNLNLSKLEYNLLLFESNIPQDFKLSSTEGVNNKKERELRNYYVTEILNNSF